MNFYTFSSEPHRHFARWLFMLVITTVAGLFALGIYLQPLYGELTRLGLFSEREFGWDGRQVIFPHPRLAFPDLFDKEGWHYDILVLGDSFSRARPESQWQNYLAVASGEYVGSLDIYKVSLDQILASREFREHPPKVLIFEAVERLLPRQLGRNTRPCQKVQVVRYTSEKNAAPTITQIPHWMTHLADLTRQTERGKSPKEVNLSYVWKYLWHRLAIDDAQVLVHKMALTRLALFSSLNQAELLVFHEDFEKIKWWQDFGIAEMECRVEAMRSQVEANGYTRFVLMVPPDKLTAYADYLSDPKLKNVSLLSGLADMHPSVMPRLDRSLIGAIRSGTQDVYLPDDTHWGSNGQRIAAETLISYLSQPVH